MAVSLTQACEMPLTCGFYYSLMVHHLGMRNWHLIFNNTFKNVQAMVIFKSDTWSLSVTHFGTLQPLSIVSLHGPYSQKGVYLCLLLYLHLYIYVCMFVVLYSRRCT